MTRLLLAATTAAALLVPQVATAQVETNDHRDEKGEEVKAKRARPAKPPVKTNDHRDRKAKRDERKAKRDERKADRKERMNDHRDRMNDHRDRMKDHRDRMKGQPGAAPNVNDHRDQPPAAGGDRPNTRVPARRAAARKVRRWHREIPSVASYWPAKGKVGRKVVIRGSGFADGTKVMWGDTALEPVKMSDRRIVIEVPAGAATGMITLTSPGFRRPIAVGQFEVAANFDPEAERKRVEAERRKAAEKAWAERQKELKKQSKKERHEALKRRREEMRKSREDRRRERVEAIRAKWAKEKFLADPQTKAELSLHAERLARLERMKRLAEVDARGKLVIRINVLIDREDQRHARRMASLEAAFAAE